MDPQGSLTQFTHSQAGQQYISDTLSRITTTVDVSASVSEADLVVEAIIENLKIKHELFAALDKAAPE